jgi:hypothetical protein
MNYRPMFEFRQWRALRQRSGVCYKRRGAGSAEDRFRVWTMPTGYGVDETADSVTYRWDSDEGDVRLPLGQESV